MNKISERTDFLNGKPRIATEREVKAPWSGGKNGKYFRCYLCGHRFEVGDQWRWVFTNDQKDGTPGGNPLVCASCDGGDEAVRAEWRRMHEEMGKPKWWWFLRGEY